jgi:hypothetical protein
LFLILKAEMRLYHLLIIILFAVGGINTTYSQKIIKGKLKINGQIISYLTMETQHQIRGIVMLLAGLGQNPQSIFNNTKLPHLLSEKGYLIIVPPSGKSLFADDHTLLELEELYNFHVSKYKLTDPALIIGGLSAGGSIAIGYAEHLLASGSVKKLKAVFAIDPHPGSETQKVSSCSYVLEAHCRCSPSAR